MKVRLVRCTQCAALTAAVGSALYAGAAIAGPVGPASEISAEVWLSLFATVLFSLLAGYSKGQERRITALEFESKQQQSQISMLREKLASEHPSRAETAEHRAYVEGKLDRIDDRFDALLMELRKGQ